MRLPLMAGNWKMNKTPAEAESLVKEILQGSWGEGVEALVCVPAIDIIPVGQALAGSPLHLGAENMYYEESGAYTGEISPLMLKDAGVEYVILGHSERRQIFGESDEVIAKKIHSALQHGLKPIVCVGESLEEREAGRQDAKVIGQIQADFKGVDPAAFSQITIAYEPIWAIGTGKTATAEDAQSMCQLIRQQIGQLFGQEAAEAVRIQYGGSVKPANVKEIMAQADVDGALVGGASLKADSFLALVNFANEEA